jgi:hypothetical protein
MFDWIKNRIMERTSWDGAKYAALAAIAWGVLTMLKSEK